MQALDRLTELYARLDAFFARARAAAGTDMACARGCTDCCQRTFTVTRVEAARVAGVLAALPAERRAEIARRGGGVACPALDDDGGCAVYEGRPAICRTHGLAIRFVPERAGRRCLPVLDTCPKNFVGQDLRVLDASVVLDQETLSTMLAGLDAALAAERAEPRGERVELRDLLR